MLHENIDTYWPTMTAKLAPKQVCLTFDDGPSDPDPHGHTLEIARFLHDHNIRATFFVVGQRIEQPAGRQTLRELVKLGHLIGNHTYTHPYLTQLLPHDKDRLLREMIDTHNLIKEFVGPGPWVLRPPFGAYSAEVGRAINSAPQFADYHGPIMVDVACRDWDLGKDVDGSPWTLDHCKTEFTRGLAKLRKGVLLIHDGSAGGVLDNEQRQRDVAKLELTTWLVQQLKRENYSFVGLDELV